VSRRRKSNSSSQPAQPQASGKPPQQQQQRRWYKADLHLHTPASRDYEQPGVTYLDWLRKVVERGLEIVAITDHNTIAGVGAIRQELEWLTRLEEQGRLQPHEQQRLDEWRELGNKVVVLPGFEFTATFGFHILAIFPPDTSSRHLEHVLLDLKVPPHKLDDGSTETGATTEVLAAYRIIREAGGLVIAAHVNSTHGVAMRNFPFGGQTKIAYTQDLNLDAMEVTDLDRSGRSTARFFNGSKPEYSRRMFCIQGSDAHRLDTDPRNPKRLGIGERATELLLDEPTFAALTGLLRSKNFDRVRPARPADKPFDALEVVREEGNSLMQSFHESATDRSGKFSNILGDICAMANSAGGVVYVGCRTGKGKIKGLANPAQLEQQLRAEAEGRLTPRLDIRFDVMQSQNAKVLRIQVPKGADLPYALDGNKFYVRDEAETSLAVRDEIVALVKEALGFEHAPESDESEGAVEAVADDLVVEVVDMAEMATLGAAMPESAPLQPVEGAPFYLPMVGVEIVGVEQRNGMPHYTIRDLRNGHVVNNVTRKGARKLWSYAIQQYEDQPAAKRAIEWRGNAGLVYAEKRAGKLRYDLALREGDAIRVFYGVTEDGMDGPWAQFLQE
jgi:hypothetical protein